ncbi:MULTISPECIES: cytochrome c biogenesis protein CcsA [unclassified Virgibacillus]|uniref:cytochrome C assembly family protein n=1 Tax=unclassified Virgibacillus TaxID=2620237 RepID=UPI002ED917A4
MKLAYEMVIAIYGLSLIGYFIDFIQHNRKVNRIAFWLLCMVWIIQAVFLFSVLIKEQRFPIQTLTDSLFFYSWTLVTFSLIINKFFRMHFIVLFTNLFGFFMLLLYILSSAKQTMGSGGVELVNEILVTHITLAVISYSFFTLSFIFSLIYIMQYRFLKKKKGLKWIRKLGDLNQMDDYSYKSVTIGVPLLLIGLTLGIVWAHVSNDEFYWFDIKTIGSIFLLFVYAGYLFLRLVRGYQGKTIALYNSAAFLILLINFFLFSLLSNFHF